MWMVSKNYIQDEPEANTVLIDSESGKIEYYGTDELYEPTKNLVFYNTKEEAEKGREQIKHELMDKMPEVKEYLNIMDDVRQDEDENSFFRFKKEDFLGYFAGRLGDNGSYARDQWRLYEKLTDMLTDYISTGFVNIKADTFRKEDVERVKWGNQRAEIVLRNGQKIETCNTAEFKFIGRVFGYNHSKFTYKHLDHKEEDE